MYAVKFEGTPHDTGEKLGFLKATVEFALARPDLADQFRAYLKSLDLQLGWNDLFAPVPTSSRFNHKRGVPT